MCIYTQALNIFSKTPKFLSQITLLLVKRSHFFDDFLSQQLFLLNILWLWVVTRRIRWLGSPSGTDWGTSSSLWCCSFSQKEYFGAVYLVRLSSRGDISLEGQPRTDTRLGSQLCPPGWPWEGDWVIRRISSQTVSWTGNGGLAGRHHQFKWFSVHRSLL